MSGAESVNDPTSQDRPSIYRSEAGRRAVRDWCTHRLDRWALPHRCDYLATSAGSTHVVTAGSGSPPIVLVPGTNANAATEAAFAARLASRGRTLVLDPPGQPGLSDGHRQRRDRLAWYGRWLGDVLAQTVTGQAIVIGISLGGGQGGKLAGRSVRTLV